MSADRAGTGETPSRRVGAVRMLLIAEHSRCTGSSAIGNLICEKLRHSQLKHKNKGV